MRIVVDLSNLAYICFYGVGYKNDIECKYDKEEFLEACKYKLEAIRIATNATETIFAKDSVAIRKELDEGYKASRKNICFPIKEDLTEMLLQRGIKVCEAENKEADDVMATLLKAGRVDCIVSTDQDLLQAITDGNQLFNPISMTFWTKDKLKNKYSGLEEFKKILFYKSFFGDASDNIPRVGNRLPKKTIVERVNKYNTLDEILDSLLTENFYSKINKDRLYLNYNLVKLNMKCKCKLISEKEA